MLVPGSAVFRYGFAVLSVALAIGARLLLDPWLGHHHLFATVFFAVLLTAWRVGMRPALVAAGLGALAAAYFLLPPRGSFRLEGLDSVVGLALYLAMSLPIALLAGEMHAARRQAEYSAAELERWVAERTLELEHANRVLRTNEALLLTVTHKADVGLVLIDSEQKYLFANQRILEFLGLRVDQVVGRPVAEVLPDLYEHVIGPRLARALAGERMRYDVERPPVDTNGPPRIFAVSYEPWTDAAGARYAVVMIDDVTDRRREEAALREREDWLRTLAESMPQMVWTASRKGGIDYCNRRWAEYTGLGETGYQDWQWQSILHPDDAQRALDLWSRSVQSGEPYETEYRLRRADGVFRWHLARALPLRDAGGRIERWLGTSTDIDPQKRSQEALQVFEQRFRLLVDGVTGHAVVLLGRHGEIETWSQGAEQIFGLTAAEALDRPLSSLFAEEDVAASLPGDEMRQAVAAGRVDVDGWRVRKDGSRFWADGSLSALFDDEGGLHGYALIVRDLTERRRSDELMRAVLDNTFDAIIAIDERGQIESFSRAAEKMFGYELSEVVGHNVRMFTPEPHRTAHDGYLRAFLETGQARVIGSVRELEGVRQDGSRFPFEIALSEFRLATDGRRHFVGILRDITARRQAEETLRREKELLEALMESVPGIFGVLDQAGRYVKWNRGLEEVTGLDAAAIDGREAGDLLDPEDREQMRQAIHEAYARGRYSAELRVRSADGRAIPYYFTGVRLGDALQGALVFNGIDISERKHLEEQLRWAQRLEAFGQLAGGVAHDFNNLLTVIGGYSEQLLRVLPAEHRGRSMVAEIRNSGERAAALTRQLLAFSRQQVLEPRVLDLNEVVAHTEKLLRRLIGEDVRLATAYASDLPAVRIDPGQIEQIILNLAVNARDAMPEGGRLTISTSSAELDAESLEASADVQPGTFVALAVADTGIGMPPEVMARIFEPFFSTKGAARGTGLGLAVVDGIVRQSGGHVFVESVPGEGTTFRIYLPAVSEAAETAVVPALLHPLGGSETILLVEDEVEVRKLSGLTLESYGYRVLQAASGQDALRLAESHPILDLLVTDVVMPEMSGRQVAEVLRARDPRLKVLYVSGYTDDAVVRHGVQSAEVAFLQKPFTPSSLARKVREVLDQEPEAGGARANARGLGGPPPPPA